MAFPFEPVSPATAVTKVKFLLTGLPPSDAEVAAAGDPVALRASIDRWFDDPVAQNKLVGLYGRLFQQTQVTAYTLIPQTGLSRFDAKYPASSILASSLAQMFPKTVASLVAQGLPFSQSVTGHHYQMNTLTKVFYAYMDGQANGEPVPGGTLPDMCVIYLGPTGAASVHNNPSFHVNPHVASFLGSHTFESYPAGATWDPWDDTLVNGQLPPGFLMFKSDTPLSCGSGANTVTYNYLCTGAPNDLPPFAAMMGRPVGAPNGQFGYGGVVPTNNGRGGTRNYSNHDFYPVNGANVCPSDNSELYMTQLYSDLRVFPPFTSNDDTADWTDVELTTPDVTPRLGFWKVKQLRAATKLALTGDRVGYFTTPAFFATWPSNNSNQSRGVMNQTLIVGLGKSINPVDSMAGTVLDNGTDGEHSDPNSPCFGCHQALDPMREIFQKKYDYNYLRQTDSSLTSLAPVFDFYQVKNNIGTMDQLAQTLVNHPLYAPSVVQNLCYYANSAPCSEDDPEFIRITSHFVASQYDFRGLIRELFSSPLVTGLATSKTLTDRGEVVSIARFDHFCTALQHRLNSSCNTCNSPYLWYLDYDNNRSRKGIGCNQGSDGNSQSLQPGVVAVQDNIPADTFTRGAEAPVIPYQPTLFFRAAVERACQQASLEAVDNQGDHDASGALFPYLSTDRAGVLRLLAQNIAGLAPSDPATAPLISILSDNWDQARAASKLAKPNPKYGPSQWDHDALVSTFVVACTSPTMTALGL